MSWSGPINRFVQVFPCTCTDESTWAVVFYPSLCRFINVIICWPRKVLQLTSIYTLPLTGANSYWRDFHFCEVRAFYYIVGSHSRSWWIRGELAAYSFMMSRFHDRQSFVLTNIWYEIVILRSRIFIVIQNTTSSWISDNRFIWWPVSYWITSNIVDSISPWPRSWKLIFF